MPDIIRVLRVLEYVGPRDLVEKTLEKSIHGVKIFGPNNEVRINAATLGVVPEILESKNG